MCPSLCVCKLFGSKSFYISVVYAVLRVSDDILAVAFCPYCYVQVLLYTNLNDGGIKFAFTSKTISLILLLNTKPITAKFEFVADFSFQLGPLFQMSRC